jgi:hypothetical protein
VKQDCSLAFDDEIQVAYCDVSGSTGVNVHSFAFPIDDEPMRRTTAFFKKDAGYIRTFVGSLK